MHDGGGQFCAVTPLAAAEQATVNAAVHAGAARTLQAKAAQSPQAAPSAGACLGVAGSQTSGKAAMRPTTPPA